MTGERVARPLQAVELVVNFGTIRKRPRRIVIPEELLAMLSEEVRRTVMDEALSANHRFKALVENLYWGKSVSVKKLSKCFNASFTTLQRWMKCKINVKMRDKVTAIQLAKTRYPKRDFDGDGVEKLKLWFLAHTDASVRRSWRQVVVRLITPDLYLALLFKEVFGRYGYVGVAPRRNNKGGYEWELWVYLPLRSFWWLLKRRTPTPIDSDVKLYSALNITIDAEGSLYPYNREGRTEFKIVLYNEKTYIIEPLYKALQQRGYRVNLYVTPKGTATNYGRSNNDYYYITVYAKAYIKRLLENVELALPHKHLKACLIKYALRDPSKPIYWSSIEPMYGEVDALYEEMLEESKTLVKSFYDLWRFLNEKHRGFTRTEYEEERARLRAEVWKSLETLKEKYDKKFRELERRIEAYFRAQKPLNLVELFNREFKVVLKHG
ncbi:MAG: hypothetical protein QXK12_03085 [Candidatus Nezhaarchaeales archaeon]